jgi:hypothetical protein
MENLRNKIEKKAYEYFLERGMVHGNDIEDWLKAEKEISKKNKHLLKSKSSKKTFSQSK